MRRKKEEMLTGLSSSSVAQTDLFREEDSERSQTLMATIDRMNRTMGRGTVFFAGQGIQQGWRMQAGMKSPAYTTDWTSLPRAHS